MPPCYHGLVANHLAGHNTRDQIEVQLISSEVSIHALAVLWLGKFNVAYAVAFGDREIMWVTEVVLENSHESTLWARP